MRWLDGITEFEQAPGIDDGQRSLVCCSPWGRKELDKTWQLNNNNSILQGLNACIKSKVHSGKL